MNLLLFFIVAILLLLQILNVKSDNLKCLESNKHKPTPSEEEYLHGQCQNWKSLSCCQKNYTEVFHLIDNWQGFNYNHCGKMSSKCKDYFLKELCLYECDPYLGNWIVKDTSKKMRKERYFHLPLCASDCNEWFEACKSDYTCRDNWNVGFKWINGTNFCPQHEKCDTFENKFKNAKNFCSQIWDESFQVEDTSNCVTFQFENASDNPNKQVNDFYAIKNSQISNRISLISYVFILAISSIFSLLIK